MKPRRAVRASALLIALLAFAGSGLAANFYTRLGGAQNWNNATVWSTAGGICSGGAVNGALPGAGDTVTICAGHNITMNISPGIRTINIIGTLSAGANTLTLAGPAGSTLFTRAGTFNQGTSTVVMSSNANVTLTGAGAVTFNNLTLSPTITAARTYTFGAGGAKVVNGNFVINPTKVTAGAATLTVNMGIAIDVNGTTTITGTTNGRGLLDATATNFALTSGNLNIAVNGTFNARASTVTLDGAAGTLLTRVGTFTIAANQTVAMRSDASVTLTSGTITFNNLQLTPVLTAGRTYAFGAGAITINTAFLINPSKAGAAATLEVDMGAAISLPATGTATIQGTGSATGLLDTTASNHPLNAGRINIASRGSFTANASTVTLNATTGVLFTRSTVAPAGVFTQGTSTVVMNPNATLNTAANRLTSGTITFHHLRLTPLITGNRTYTFGAAATTCSGDFLVNPTDNAGGANTLTVNMAAAITVVGNTTVQGSGTSNGVGLLQTTAGSFALTSGRLLVLTNGTFVANTSMVTLNAGSGTLFTRTGTFTQGTSTVVLSPTAPVTLNSGTITFNSLTTNMPGQTATLANDITVNAILDFDFDDNATADGYLVTGTNAVIISPAASISAAGAGGHVVGNLTRQFLAGSVFLYTVGDGANYAPVNVVFTANVTGNLTVSASPPIDHPNTVAGTSPAEPNRSVNRYWTIKGSTIAGTADLTFSYLAGSPRDLDSGVNASGFVIGRGGPGTCTGTGSARQCTTWTRPALVGLPTPTQAVADNVAFANAPALESDFVIGEVRRVAREKEFIYTRETY